MRGRKERIAQAGKSTARERRDTRDERRIRPATRRKMASTVGATREVQNVSVCLAIDVRGVTAIVCTILSDHLRVVEML